MQNSNLSSKIFPIIKGDWAIFIQYVEHNLQEMMVNYKEDKRRMKEIERLISKLKEIFYLSKDNIKEILNYKELFMYIDNSLESSFDALNFFIEQNNFDNPAVKAIYERIINSKKILRINSEYNELLVKIRFDKERIKKLGELIQGVRFDYGLVRELLNKYEGDSEFKKNILLYVMVILSVKQNNIKNSEKNEDKEKFYQDHFNELIKLYQSKKESYKELLLYCFNIRKNMSREEISMYGSYASNPDEINSYGFDDEAKFKIYTLALFKIKSDIEKYIDGIMDLQLNASDLDSEMVFFHEMISEFEGILNKLSGFQLGNNITDDVNSHSIYFALDSFNRIIINQELLLDKNKSSIKALLQKADTINNARIEGVKTYHMLGIDNAEKLLGKTISMITTSKMKIAYIVVNKSVLIITGVDINDEKFDRKVEKAVNDNLRAIKNQITLIEQGNIDYIEFQNKIINGITGEEEAKKLM